MLFCLSERKNKKIDLGFFISVDWGAREGCKSVDLRRTSLAFSPTPHRCAHRQQNAFKIPVVCQANDEEQVGLKPSSDVACTKLRHSQNPPGYSHKPNPTQPQPPTNQTGRRCVHLETCFDALSSLPLSSSSNQRRPAIITLPRHSSTVPQENGIHFPRRAHTQRHTTEHACPASPLYGALDLGCRAHFFYSSRAHLKQGTH